MRIVKFIITEETLLWDWKQDPYRRLKEISDMDWNLLFSFDPLNPNLDVRIKEMF